MVRMVRLQYYRHNYGLVCMTGLLGCRWHRYKQSTRDNRKRDVSWFIVLLLTAFFTIIIFYFTLVADNSYYSFDRGLFELTGRYIHWYTLLLAIICVIFSYIVILLLLSLCHIVRGHQLYIHPLHLAIILLVLTICVTLTITSDVLWESQWAVFILSLKIVGPFLWLGTVFLMTALTWVISHRCYKIIHPGWKLLCLGVYISVMICLYIAPPFIASPCVIERKYLPDKPKLFGHRGSTAYAPENTVISFERASPYVYGFETDIKITSDGVLFLLHDTTLRRTTNVQSLYPGLDSFAPYNFNISQIQKLNAGSWYLENDPNYNLGDLSDEDAALYANQSVPTFDQFLQLALKYDKDVMFDIDLPDKSHPNYTTMPQMVVDAIKMSGIAHEKVWWLSESPANFTPPDYRFTLPHSATVEYLRQHNMSGINIGAQDVVLNDFQTYRQHNLTTTVYIVNSAWLYSLYWCAGADFITTNACRDLHDVDDPIWHLSPSSYLTLWLAMDILSAVIIVTIFIVQRIRLYGTKFSPEQVSLSSGSFSMWSRPRNHSARRSLKEKLILQEISADIFDVVQERDSELGIESNGYDATVTATEGRILANQLHSNRERLKTEVEVV